jgi:hypothetical protein
MVWEAVWRFHKKLKIEMPYNPVILLLSIYPKEGKAVYNRDTCTSMFIVALFTIAKLWIQPRCPTIDEQIKKMWHIYIMEFYSAISTNDIMGFKGKWMQLVNIMLSDVSQVKKDTGHMFISHMWKIDPNDKFIHKNRHDHIQTHM